MSRALWIALQTQVSIGSKGSSGHTTIMASPTNLMMSPPYLEMPLTNPSIYRFMQNANSSHPQLPILAHASDILVKPLWNEKMFTWCLRTWPLFAFYWCLDSWALCSCSFFHFLSSSSVIVVRWERGCIVVLFL